ncbi:MAG: glycosyltransferase family 4 protein [Anaerolineales bacterium]
MNDNTGSPLRIALVIARLNVGGPATHVIELAAGLPRDEFEVRLITGREGPGETGMHYLAEQMGVKPEILLQLSPRIGPADVLVFLRLRAIFRNWKPDVVHTHTAKAGAVGRTAARCAGVPVVVHTFHGHVLRGYFSPPVEFFFRSLERMLARITDKIVTLSPALKADLVDMGIAPAGKIDVVPLGMNLDPLLDCSSRRGELRSELGIGPDQPLIGIVGRLVAIKNHRLFLEAARSMVDSGNPAHFAIVGDGELRNSLQELASEMGIASRVHFLGWKKDMLPVYAAFDLLALTSDNEGTPVAVIEAMAAGVPVVATAVGGVPDVIRDGETGWLVPPGDASALRRAWLAALRRDPSIEAAIIRGQREVLERFGQEQMISTMADLYRRLASKTDETARIRPAA